MNDYILVVKLSLLLMFISTAVIAQENPSAQYPGLIKGLEVEAGVLYRADSSEEDDSFYKITYRGSQIDERGTPFKFATHLDLESPKLEAGMGDRNSLTLKFENGATKVGSGLFEIDVVQPIELAGFSKNLIRGNAYFSSNTDVVNYSIGLETRPFRLPGFAKTNWSNWVVFGVNAQRTESNGDVRKVADSGLFTYRLFAGKAFGWRKSADLVKTKNNLMNGLLKLAPTHDESIAAFNKIMSISASSRTELQQLFHDAYIEHSGSTASWRQTLSDMADGYADAITDQPTLAFYLENSGWYDVDADDDEFKNLFTATADYWFLRHRDDVLLRLRYENGYERSLPEVKKDQVSLLLAFKF